MTVALPTSQKDACIVLLSKRLQGGCSGTVGQHQPATQRLPWPLQPTLNSPLKYAICGMGVSNTASVQDIMQICSRYIHTFDLVYGFLGQFQTVTSLVCSVLHVAWPSQAEHDYHHKTCSIKIDPNHSKTCWFCSLSALACIQCPHVLM